MDLYIKKQDLDVDMIFDLVVDGNDIQKDSSYLTASLLSIFTDGSKPQIGTQIGSAILGNAKYNIEKLSEDNIKAYKTGLKNALKWLISDKIVKDVIVVIEKQGNRLNVQITFTKLDSTTDALIFSLDEKFEVLD